MTPPDTSHSAVFLGIIGAASVIANFVWVLLLIFGRGQTRRIEPSPLEVKPAEQWVSRREWTTDHGLISERLQRIEAEMGAIRSDAVDARTEFRTEMTEALVRVHQRLDSTNETLASTPASIIAILRNTGVIK